MNPAASGAADFQPAAAADNSAGRRQHRAPLPARQQEEASKRTPRSSIRSKSPFSKAGAKSRDLKDSFKTAGERERELESRDVAAVHPDGAEADAARPNRADAVGEDERPHPPTGSPSRLPSLQLSCLKGDPSQGLSPASTGSLKEKAKKQSGEEGTALAGSRRDRSGEYGCRPGLSLWGGGCLQTELIHFHLHKRLKRSGGKMQTKAASSVGSEAVQAELEPATEATEAGSVTQQDQALRDEMERLQEENEDLKV